MRVSLFIWIILLSLSSAEESIEEEIKPLLIPSITEELVIDGKLEEKAWQSAQRIELLYEVEPGENIPPPVKTEVLFTSNATHFYVAFICYDPRPEEILARFWGHDKAWDDDWVGIALDTFNGQKRAYELISNPLGMQIDAINDDINKEYDISWNAIWDSAGTIHDEGYTVEMAIPLNQIRFQVVEGEQVWGFDCYRRYPRTFNYHIGAFPRDRDNPNYLSQTLKLKGFAGIQPGKNIQLTPTLTYAQIDQNIDPPNGSLENIHSKTEAGITGRWSISPSVTVNGAINPDFSQVEADSVQLAINEQFALFFKETRPFFKENADYFKTPINLLHTRTIADPSAAIKLTGKTGPHTFGVFSAKDERTDILLPGPFGSRYQTFSQENTSSVGRYRMDFGKNSTTGVMVTSREGSGYYNRVLSGDLNYRFNTNDDLTLNYAVSQTQYNQEMKDELDAKDGELKDNALLLRYRHIKRNYSFWARYDFFGEDFRSDLGFNPQVGYELFRAGLERKWYFDNSKPFTLIGFGGDYDRKNDEDNHLIEEEYELWFWIQGKLQSEIVLVVLDRTKTYLGQFFDQSVWFQKASTRPWPFLKLKYEIRGGDEIDYANNRPATSFGIEPEFDLLIGKHVTLSSSYSYKKLKVDDKLLYRTQVQEHWINYNLNKQLHLRAIIQIADIERNQEEYSHEVQARKKDFFSQILFSYQVNPQTVAFLGYSDNYLNTDQMDRLQVGRQVFAKLSYAWLN